MQRLQVRLCTAVVIGELDRVWRVFDQNQTQVKPARVQAPFYCGREERLMPGYRVHFLNEIPRNDRLFKCCQRSIVIRAARTPERAIEAAKRRFARLEGVRDWLIHASLIEIEPIALEATPPSPPTLQPPVLPASATM